MGLNGIDNVFPLNGEKNKTMTLTYRIKYFLPFAFFICSFADMSLSSYVWDGSIGAFSNTWFKLIPITLVIFSLIFYFYTWKGGRYYQGKRKYEPKLLGALKTIFWLLVGAVILAYSIFHLAVWNATYIPGMPTKVQEVLVVKKHEANRGRYMITAEDMQGQTIYAKFAWLHPFFKEGDVIALHCKNAKWVCRINDIQVNDAK
jgi:hypothetical protein